MALTAMKAESRFLALPIEIRLQIYVSSYRTRPCQHDTSKTTFLNVDLLGRRRTMVGSSPRYDMMATDVVRPFSARANRSRPKQKTCYTATPCLRLRFTCHGPPSVHVHISVQVNFLDNALIWISTRFRTLLHCSRSNIFM